MSGGLGREKANKPEAEQRGQAPNRRLGHTATDAPSPGLMPPTQRVRRQFNPLDPRAVVRLQRSVGNAAVARLIVTHKREILGYTDYEDAIKATPPDWKQAARSLNVFNQTDIDARLTKLTHEQRLRMFVGAREIWPTGDVPVTQRIAALDPAAARVGQLTFVYEDALRRTRSGDAKAWGKAAVALNQFNESDIDTKLAKLTHEQRLRMFVGARETWGVGAAELPVTEHIAALDPEAARVGQPTFVYEDALRRARSGDAKAWGEAAVALNPFHESDIDAKLGLLANPELVRMKKGAPAWVTRVTKAIVRIATTAAFRGMVDKRMTWNQSWSGSAASGKEDTFTAWARAPSGGPEPALTPATRLNCWEAVLLAAHRSGLLSWARIHEVYEGSDADWEERMKSLLGGSAVSYRIGDPATPRPASGNIVFFNGLNHVALATGVVVLGTGVDTPGGSEVISFWPPPNTPFTPGGTVDAVKFTTIEKLNTFSVGAGWGPFHVTFGAPGW